MPQDVTLSQDRASSIRLPSVLFETDPRDTVDTTASRPDCFGDLNLGQLVASVLKGRERYDLSGYFHLPLASIESVTYRQAIFRDLEDQRIAARIVEFSHHMESVRNQLARKCYYAVQKQSAILNAAMTYVEAVTTFRDQLMNVALNSEGMCALRDRLSDYVGSVALTSLARDAEAVHHSLGLVRYRVRISGDLVQVSAVIDDEEDYTLDVATTFARFRQGEVKSYPSQLRGSGDMDHVEAAIASFVARLFPDAFAALEAFSRLHADFVEPSVERFDREVQFYLAYLELMARLQRSGLTFCYPIMTTQREALTVRDTFDLALADELTPDAAVVTNDFHVESTERVLVVTGPNQGGKTTFARTFGQLHYLASLGVPVPGSGATLPLPDHVYTLFERGENLEDLRGHLQDDLTQVHQKLQSSTERTVLVVNEVFTSTALDDATFLAAEILREIIQLGAPCVFVTFMDELSTLSESTVSFVAEVDPDDTSHRTFKITRRPADGLAYAKAVATRYGLGYDTLMARLES